MRRYLSIRRTAPATPTLSEKDAPRTVADAGAISAPSMRDEVVIEDNASTTALLPASTLAPPNLKIKRVDYYYSWWSKTWKYRNTGDKIVPERAPVGAANPASDPWGAFCFVVVRTFPREKSKGKEEPEPTFRVVVKSLYLLKACKEVIQEYPGLSWNVEPVSLDPQLLITFLPLFEEYRDKLQNKQRALEEDYTLSSVTVLLEYLHRDYHNTISTLARLTSHGEITFALLHALFVPRSILLTTCPTTGEPRAVQLISVTKTVVDVNSSSGLYDLLCESVDASDEAAAPARGRTGGQGATGSFGRVSHKVVIPHFEGTIKIAALDAYPIQYAENAGALKVALVDRGRRWAALRGIHHVQYDGRAVMATTALTGLKRRVKYNVSSRIMIDRANFRRLNPNYEMPLIKQEAPAIISPPPPQPGLFRTYSRRSRSRSRSRSPTRVITMPPPVPYTPGIQYPMYPVGVPVLNADGNSKFKPAEEELSDEELMLASPVVYGYSLSDKLWLEFNVEHVSDIKWNDEAFANLVLPQGRKTLLLSLVEAHDANLDFDDFVQGKGQGLVVNLFGPPGVGKTLSAEATSEHVRRPLYVVGGADLGTTAADLDAALQRVFDTATSWQALVLIDEADVFLEQRSLHDLERNAMVAVFLRHLEYYRGVLFLTTNRVRTFDEAFLSRIHVALHFRELSPEARRQVWTAFLRRVGVVVGAAGSVSEAEMERLAAREVNGRQIKNATRTACSLATARGERLEFGHLIETLDAMEEFTAEFRNMNTA